MKKNTLFIISIIICVSAIGVYVASNFQVNESTSCNVNELETDSYVSKVLNEGAIYKVQEEELERQATDGSSRKIYADKNDKVVLIEDRHSGETGFRVVSVILQNNKVVKVIDTLTNYTIPPIEDPNSRPTITKGEFYIADSKVCSWYKEDELANKNKADEQEYLRVIEWIISDAESIAQMVH